MTDLTLYHNPAARNPAAPCNCLEERGLTPTIIRYLETPPNPQQLRELLAKLGLGARQLLRCGEDEYQSLGLANPELNDDQLIEAMAAHPKLIERPILVAGDRAVVGRPPEKVLELLP